MLNQSETLYQRMNAVQWGALFLAALGLVLSVVLALTDLDHFFHIYLTAFLVCLEIAVGCLGLWMVGNLVGGKWSYTINRFASAGARTIPLFAAGFLLLLFGLNQIYPWVEEGVVTGNRGLYLSVGFFIIRAIIYFAIWIALAYTLHEWSVQHDRTGDPALLTRIRVLSVAGLILLFATCTFAAMDWTMSLDEKWFSSVYGWLSMSRMALGAFSMLIVLVWLFYKRAPMSRLVDDRAWSDLGALTFVSLAMWAYLSFMQYAIYWSANLPSKVVFFDARTIGAWAPIAGLLVFFHAIPFVLILVPGLMRARGALVSVAIWLLVMRVVDMWWVVLPANSPDAVTFYALDLGVLLLVGSLATAFMVYWLKQSPLLPQRDPDLEQLLLPAPEERSTEIIVRS